jgi:acyl carrier protein
LYALEIRDVLLKHLRENVSGLSDIEIDTTNTFAHYGAKSLDIVEIVSRSIRELKVTLPRTEINKAKNINGLIDLLANAKKL